MTDEKLKRANEIQLEIDKIIEENNQIIDYGMPKSDDNKLFRIRPIILQLRKRRFRLGLKKSRYGYFPSEDLFELSPSDVRLLFDSRIKRVHELKKELKEL